MQYNESFVKSVVLKSMFLNDHPGGQRFKGLLWDAYTFIES